MNLARLTNLLAPFGGGSAPAPSAAPRPRDEDIVADVVARLTATGRFAEVVRDVPLGEPPISDSPSAVVGLPQTWTDVDPDIDDDVHAGTLEITIRVRDGTADDPLAALDLLARAAQQALHRQGLADETIPPRTMCTRAKGVAPGRSGPDWVAVLTVSYEYLIPFGSGFDLSEA